MTQRFARRPTRAAALGGGWGLGGGGGVGWLPLDCPGRARAVLWGREISQPTAGGCRWHESVRATAVATQPAHNRRQSMVHPRPAGQRPAAVTRRPGLTLCGGPTAPGPGAFFFCLVSHYRPLDPRVCAGSPGLSPALGSQSAEAPPVRHPRPIQSTAVPARRHKARALPELNVLPPPVFCT